MPASAPADWLRSLMTSARASARAPLIDASVAAHHARRSHRPHRRQRRRQVNAHSTDSRRARAGQRHRAPRDEPEDRLLRSAARAARSRQRASPRPSVRARTGSRSAGERKHIMSYLAGFPVSAAARQSPVRMLSGGERNRLLLARLFARPANLLVLDEPTNDLDIESLELLEQRLQDYDGTLHSGEPRSQISRQRRHADAGRRGRRASGASTSAATATGCDSAAADGGRALQSESKRRAAARQDAHQAQLQGRARACGPAAGDRGARTRASRSHGAHE